MDARWSIIILLAAGLVQGICQPAAAANGELRTENFIIWGAPDEAFAKQVGEAAEHYRRELAMKWTGSDLPPWPAPCTLRVVAGNMPAQGVTTYQRYPGHVGDFQMEVVGSPQRILDSVLPHEITHAVLATYFGKPLPRWADEGISTTVEHASERAKHDAKLREFLRTRRGLPMNRMFMMKEYPSDMLPLYAQGYSVCRFLIEQKGDQEFIQFLKDYMDNHSWTNAVRRHYGYESLAELQEYWLAWVAEGSGPVDRFVKNAAPPAADQDAVPVIAASNTSGGSSQSNPPSIMLASDSGEGSWYQRRRQHVLSGRAPDVAETAPADVAPAAYSAAQPQGEQGVGAGIPLGAATPWAPSGNTLRR